MLNHLLAWDFQPPWISRRHYNRSVHESQKLRTELATARTDLANARMVNEDVGRENIRLTTQVETLQAAYADLTVAYDTLDSHHEQVSTLAKRAVLLLQQLSPTRKPSQALMRDVVALLAEAREAGIVEMEKQEEESHA